MSDEHSLNYERKELNKAQNLGIAGLIGALIPIIGLLLGIISLVISSSVKPEHPSTKSKKNSTEWIAIIAIFLSVAAGAGYYFIYHQKQVDSQKREAAAQKAAEDAAQAKKFHENAVQATLDYCLDQAYKSYKKAWDADVKYLGSSNGRLPETYASQHESNYKDAKDECYRAQAAGDDSHPFNF